MSGDTGLDAKRVYGQQREGTTLYAAGPAGLTRVHVAGDRIGRFELAHRTPARDVAGRGGRLLVATAEDVLVGTAEGFEPTGFGPARAVGIDADGRLLAAAEGRVAALAGDRWERVGGVGEPRAMDGSLLAAGDGVYEVGDRVTRVSERPAADVASAGPYAARADGLYALGEERPVREGAHAVVASDGDRAHAVADGRLVERRGDSWEAVDLPVDDPVADVAHGAGVYAVTEGGTVLVRAPAERTPDGHGGWRSRALGTPARRLAAP